MPLIFSAGSSTPDIPLFDRNQYSVEQLATSTLKDGIPDVWKSHYGFSVIDSTVANADFTGTGVMNVEKYQLNLYPLPPTPVPVPVAKPKATAQKLTATAAAAQTAAPIPSILNGEFTESTPPTWTSGAASNYLGGSAGKFQYGYVQNSGPTGWKAYVGTKMEVWKVGGNNFVELDATTGNHGVKQTVQNAVAGDYLLTWKHLGRSNSAAGNNGYRAIVYTEGPGGATDRIQLAERKYPDSGTVGVTSWDPQALPFTLKAEDLAPMNAPVRTLWIAFDSNDNNTYGSLIDEVNLSLMEIVRKDDSGEYRSVKEIPIMIGGNGVGYGTLTTTYGSLPVQMTVSFTHTPSSTEADTLEFSITNSERGDTIADTLTETGSDTLTFSDGESSIVIHPEGISPQSNEITVEATFPSIGVQALNLTLVRNLTSPQVFTNTPPEGASFGDATPRAPTEDVEVFRVRTHSNQSANMIEMTIMTSVDEQRITLTRSTGTEFLSEKMILVRNGGNVSLIPESSLYRVIQADGDKDHEIKVKDDVSGRTVISATDVKPAYVAQSFTDGNKPYGEKFVERYERGLPSQLGWALVGGAGDKSATKAKFLLDVPKCGLVTWFGHGLVDRTTRAFFALGMVPPAGSTVIKDKELTPAELPAGLDNEFVFINGCASATPGNVDADAFITKFNTKAYLGWNNTASSAAAATLANKLLDEADNTKPLQGAVANAWANVSLVVKLAAIGAGAPGVPRLVWKPSMTAAQQTTFTIDKKP